MQGREGVAVTTPRKDFKNMKFYVIEYENGAFRHGYFNSYSDALNYAESGSGGHDFTVSEYDSEDDYFNNL